MFLKIATRTRELLLSYILTAACKNAAVLHSREVCLLSIEISWMRLSFQLFMFYWELYNLNSEKKCDAEVTFNVFCFDTLKIFTYCKYNLSILFLNIRKLNWCTAFQKCLTCCIKIRCLNIFLCVFTALYKFNFLQLSLLSASWSVSWNLKSAQHK